ncbi:MAG: MMPL family transporter [Gemmataceae bacterium]|nr:MMPL family transporter [Gemmataceae bacterium]
MFQGLGRITAKYPWTICAVWLILGIGLTVAAPRWEALTEDDDVRFLPERFTSVRAYHLLEEAFPQEVFACRLVFVIERPHRSLTERDFQLVDTLVADLSELRRNSPGLKIGKIDSYQDGLVGVRLVSPDMRCTLIQVSLGTPYLAFGTHDAVAEARKVVQRRLAAWGEDVPTVYATGSAGIGYDLTHSCGTRLDDTTWATVLLVIVVLLAVYRAPLLALIPLATIAGSVWVALDMLALLTLVPGVHLVNISKIFAIVILYGAGTDYCLFLVSRYREELEAGHDVETALCRAIGGVGEALTASAGTVMVGLGLMALAEFAKVRYAGPAIALALGVALVASLTLTPALLRLFGPRAFWPGAAPGTIVPRSGRRCVTFRLGFWDWISRRVASRPATVWAVSVVVLIPLVIVGLGTPVSYRATNEVPPDSESLRGLAVVQRHFSPGAVGPVTILLAADADWTSDEGRRQLSHLSRGLARLPKVTEVRSLTQPLGFDLPELEFDADQESLRSQWLAALKPLVDWAYERVDVAARPYYVGQARDGRSVARLDVVLSADPFTAEAVDTLQTIQTYLAKEMPRVPVLATPIQAECYGITACAHDLATVTDGDRRRVNSCVLAAILLILLVLVRRLTLSLYLLVTVLASYYAALGATVLAGVLWNGAPLASLDWRVPFFLFTILVAVGEDYNILLVSRALEERRRHGSIEGMRRAVATTGGAITSCGLIMAGTFATLMLAGYGTLMQIGFALACGVLIDTFIVRPFLVPAFAMLYWHEPTEPELTKARPVEGDGSRHEVLKFDKHLPYRQAA